MATININAKCDLNKPVVVRHLDGMVFSQDVKANMIRVSVFRDREPVDLSGGSVSANIIRADGATVVQTGTIEGNVCSVVLPSSAYAVPGQIAIFVKHSTSAGPTTSTIAAITGYVYKSTTDTIVDPGSVVPNVNQLLAMIEDCEDATEACIAATAAAPVIDDTAGAGDTNKVWSASKASSENSVLKSAVDNQIPYQIENPYAMSNEVDGYFNTDGTIHAQTGTKEKACMTFFRALRKVPFMFRVFVKIPEGGSAWNRIITYSEDKAPLSAISTAPTLVGTTEDGYSIYEYYNDGQSLGSSIRFVRYSYRSFGDAYVQFMYGNTGYVYTKNYRDIEAEISNISPKRIYKFDSYNLRSIAHRGWTGSGEPENTIWSFKSAVNHNFKFIETDLAFTKDNIPVLIHDETINRTGRNADGTEISETIRINSITYEQALTYDFGIWKGEQYAGTRIPTLEDFLVFCRNTETYPYIELKYRVGNSQTNINSVIAMIKKYNMIDCVTFVSYDIVDFLAYVKTADETVRLGALINVSLSDAATRIDQLNALKTQNNRVFWDYSYSYFSQDEINIINAAITNGVEIEAWTLGSTEATQNMNDYVTGVTSDNINFAELKRAKALS